MIIVGAIFVIGRLFVKVSLEVKLKMFYNDEA